MLARIDHLVYTAPTLQTGIDAMEDLLGVRPVEGGRHPQWGTCNALLGLGPGRYLEVIARDPDLPEPSAGPPRVFTTHDASRLSTWAAKGTNLTQLRHMAARARIELGEVVDGMRRHSSGREFRWQLTNPFTHIFDGIVPFFIDWGDSPHPSSLIPPVGTLQKLVLKHPEPSGVSRVLADLGVELDVVPGSSPGLMATIETPRGMVVLE